MIATRWAFTIELGCGTLAALALALPRFVASAPHSLSVGLICPPLFAAYVLSAPPRSLVHRAGRALMHAAFLGLGAWLGQHAIGTSVTVVALASVFSFIFGEDTPRQGLQAAQRARRGNARKQAITEHTAQQERYFSDGLATVEQLAFALEQLASTKMSRPLANGVVTRVEQAGGVLRNSLRSLPTVAPVQQAGALPRRSSLAQRIRRRWEPDIGADLKHALPLFLALLAPAIYIGALDPTWPLVSFALTLIVGLRAKHALADGTDKEVLGWCGVFVTLFLLSTGLVVVHATGGAIPAYCAMHALSIMGHSMNLRASARHWVAIVPISLGASAAALFTNSAEQSSALAIAVVAGIVASIGIGIFVEREDARVDAEEHDRAAQLEALERAARTKLQRLEDTLLSLLGHVHDASNALIALSALNARVKRSAGPPDDASEQRASALLAVMVERLRQAREPSTDAGTRQLVRTLVERAVSLLGTADASATVTLEGEDANLLMSDDAFTRVVENLVQNAKNALGERGGAILVCWRADASAPGRLRLEVHDSGRGLKGGRWPTPRRSGHTTGVGLGAIVARKLVEEAGGQVGAERSMRLGGACFWIELPTKSSSSVTAPQ